MTLRNEFFERPLTTLMQTSKSHIESRSEEEVEIKTEEKFSATEEFNNLNVRFAKRDLKNQVILQFIEEFTQEKNLINVILAKEALLN